MMEGFVINIIATIGFSFIFLVSFLAIYYLYIYYLYLKGNEGEVWEEDKVKDKNKRLGKGF